MMSSDPDNDFSVIDFEKPLKRVRFSDEIKHVYEYEPELDENNENSSLENESETASIEFQSLDHEESTRKVVDSDNVKDTANSISECCDDKDELIGCNKQMSITDDSCEVDCCAQSGERSSFVVSDSQTVDYFNNNDSNMADLNLLICETKHMTISSSEQAQEVNHHASSEQLEMCSSGDSISEKTILQVAEQPVEQNIVSTSLTRKRSLKGTLIERQTSKLNSCLRSNNSELGSARDIKNAVFSAWNKIKNESAKAENMSFVPEVKEKTDILPIPSAKKFENMKDARLKTAKRNAKKFNFKESEPISRKRKEDIEESKMAFRAWKKKKDELLNQQIAEKCKKEEKKRLDALMNERMRKSDAESAYLAWISHKAAVLKKDKKKSEWLLERENNKITEKIKRNDEAAKVYYKWLKNKTFSKDNDFHIINESKPPWTPPGKVNSLI